MRTNATATPRKRSRAKRLWTMVLASLIGLGCTWHVTATALYLLPKNPLSNTYIPSVKKYMAPFFEQNWHLFSPNPVTKTERVIVRCQDKDGKESGWIDPSSSVLAHHGRLLGVTGRSYVLRSYIGLSREVSEEIDTRREACGVSADCIGNAHKGLLEDVRFAHVARYGMQTCQSWSKSATRAEVQLAVLPPRPFSKRKENWSAPVLRTPLGNLEMGRKL